MESSCNKHYTNLIPIRVKLCNMSFMPCKIFAVNRMKKYIITNSSNTLHPSSFTSDRPVVRSVAKESNQIIDTLCKNMFLLFVYGVTFL